MTPSAYNLAAPSSNNQDIYSGDRVDSLLYQATTAKAMHNRISRGRDSMDWLDMHKQQRQLHDFSVDSVMAESPGSIDEKFEARMEKLSRLSTASSVNGDISASAGHIAQQNIPTVEPAMMSRRSSIGVNGQLQNQKEIDAFLPNMRTISTPNSANVRRHLTDLNDLSSDMHRFNHGNNSEWLKQMLSETFDSKLNEMRQDFRSEIHAMQESITMKLHAAENEIKFYQDQYYHQGFAGNFKLFRLMENEIEMLKEGLAILLRSDDLAKEYFRLKEENEELKRQLSG